MISFIYGTNSGVTSGGGQGAGSAPDTSDREILAALPKKRGKKKKKKRKENGEWK